MENEKENIIKDKEYNNKKAIKNKEKKIGIKLYIFIFLLIYFCLQIGFSGLYTYTTIGVLFTCLMYFSVFLLFSIIYTFFKFRKKSIDENKINNILKLMFKYIAVIILIFSVGNIYSYINNMNGILREKESYSVHVQKIDNTIQNNVDDNMSQDEEEYLSTLQSMLDYTESVNDFDKIYNKMKEKMFAYIGFRILTAVIDIAVSAGIIFIVLKRFIFLLQHFLICYNIIF